MIRKTRVPCGVDPKELDQALAKCSEQLKLMIQDPKISHEIASMAKMSRSLSAQDWETLIGQ